MVEERMATVGCEGMGDSIVIMLGLAVDITRYDIGLEGTLLSAALLQVARVSDDLDCES